MQGAIGFLGYGLHPGDSVSVKPFGNGKMRHRFFRCRAMPVSRIRWDPDNVAGSYFFDRPAVPLDPTAPGNDVQGLAQRMRMPGSSRTRGKRHDSPADARRGIGAILIGDLDIAGKPLCWSGRWLLLTRARNPKVGILSDSLSLTGLCFTNCKNALKAPAPPTWPAATRYRILNVSPPRPSRLRLRPLSMARLA